MAEVKGIIDPGETAGTQQHEQGDFHAWLLNQAASLRDRRQARIDWEGIAEEVEAMARSEEHGLESFLEVLLTHLLKWAYEPERRSESWEASIENSCDQINARLQRSPSLKVKLPELAQAAYTRARRTVGAEMGLTREQWNKLLPQSCEWSVDDILDPEFWPQDRTLPTG
jgi:Domain of unknown function DUF29